jgi:succinate dehydrogenase hydrophobic anchor subunit
MLNEKSVPKTGENVWIWLLKIVTGVLVIALLFTHLVVNHLVASEGLLTYQEVVAYLSNPWVAVMEMSFLVIVVSHALVGTRSIILDLNPSRSMLRLLDGLFTLVGIASVVYGVWLIQVIISQG